VRPNHYQVGGPPRRFLFNNVIDMLSEHHYAPSPFHERDLDQDAEDYIVGSAEEAPRQHPLRLVIHMPSDQLPHTGAPDLATAIHHYFAYREIHEPGASASCFATVGPRFSQGWHSCCPACSCAS
jgi:hypothetical protein